MIPLNLNQANERTREELSKISRELGRPWEICDYSEFELTSQKGYTARAESHLYFHKTLAGGEGRLVAVLFQPGDNTGNQKWIPRKKEGKAELFLSLGSSVDGEWFSGLTHLVALDEPFNPEDMLPQEIFAYKELTASSRQYLEKLRGFNLDKLPRRLDFTYDKSRNFGDPHVIGFSEATVIGARPHEIDYQIGAFVSFPRECPELNILREKVIDGYLEEGCVREDIIL